MTETQRKVFDAFTASAKAWFTMEAERLEWHKIEHIQHHCKTYLATYFDEIEDGETCVDNRLVLEIGVFHDCEHRPGTECTGCSEVESIYYSIGGDSASEELLMEWADLFNADPSDFMPDMLGWDGNPLPEDGDDDEDDIIRCDWDDYDDDDPDGDFDFADPTGVSSLRRATASNPRNLPCGQCGRENVLTPKDKHLGYVCDTCANQNEKGW
jgi:hypothetical protein